MYHPQLALYSSHPKRNDLSIIAPTTPHSAHPDHYHYHFHDRDTKRPPSVHLIPTPLNRTKKSNAFDRRKIPSPAIFICCIFRQVIFPKPYCQGI